MTATPLCVFIPAIAVAALSPRPSPRPSARRRAPMQVASRPLRASGARPSDRRPSDPPHRLAWKDRVALYAQLSAERTLEALLVALRSNARSGPRMDDGIDALYAFANVDVWALSHHFFGRGVDLGQFERFKRVIVATPYDILFSHYHVRSLSELHVSRDVYVCRKAFHRDALVSVFTFSMSRSHFGVDGATRWMVDSIIHQQPQKHSV